ncbi:MAG: ribonucleoside-diphosphate reductase subunit alpha [Flavobacteriales bacterium]
MKTHPIAEKLGWTAEKEFPFWGNNELYLTTIKGGYLLNNETPFEVYKRLAQTVAKTLKKPALEEKFFDILWKGWLIPSTPVMVNLGTEKGLPISCFSSRIGDSMYEIYRKNLEMAMLSKYGGGTAYDFSLIRPIGSPIKNGDLGTSDGIIPFIKSYDSTIIASKQGRTRRGAVAVYLNINHKEYPQFLEIREPKGDINRQCHNIHQGAVISNTFMEKVISEDGDERQFWLDTLKKRVKTGEPYLFFIDNSNKNLPENWKKNNLKIWHSNLCSEIMLPTDETHTLVCCLSSLNLYQYKEWKDTDTVFLSILFLDAVIQEFIDKGKNIRGIEDAVCFAEKSRALGLGALGWHSLLQSIGIPFISIKANALNKQIFQKIQTETERATRYLAKTYGEVEWTQGTGRRNLTLTAIAPNRSSAKLAGGLSQGVEPIAANIYVDDDAKGMHIRKNIQLEILLSQKRMNIPEIWDQIAEKKGSCLSLKFLTDEEKECFKCFKEINQLELIRQAGLRQRYIDQGQSINLAFPQDTPAKLINQVHIEAWKMGLKSLYYYRSESILRAETKMRDLYAECLLCES